jgi:LPS-assembly lipoprotein
MSIRPLLFITYTSRGGRRAQKRAAGGGRGGEIWNIVFVARPPTRRATRVDRPAWGAVRKMVVIFSAMTLAACGFHPLYGRGGASPAIMASIYVDPIPDRTGYELRNSLTDLFDSGGGGSKQYRLKVRLSDQRKGIALQNDATITRYNYLLDADYELFDSTGKVVTSGHQSTLTAYNVVSSPYATLSAQQDAQKRAAQDLSQRIQLDLGVFFARRRQ